MSAAAAANIDELRKQAAERDQALERKQQQLDVLVAQAEGESARRLAAEQKIQELTAEGAALRDSRDELEIKVERRCVGSRAPYAGAGRRRIAAR